MELISERLTETTTIKKLETWYDNEKVSNIDHILYIVEKVWKKAIQR